MSNNRFSQLLQNASANFAARGGKRNGPKLRKQWTRQILKVSRFDTVEWSGNVSDQARHSLSDLYLIDTIDGVRNDAEVDTAIADLFYGDLSNPDERPGYLNAPELLQDIFMAFLKPQPTLYKKAEVKKDARLNGKFIEQVMALPVYEEIHEYSMTDPETSKDAMLACVEVVKEMIKQHREAVQEANEQRQQDGCDPNGPPGNSDNKENWDEETPGQGGGQGQGQGDGQGQNPQQSPGANKDQGGKSQFDKGEEEQEGQDGEGEGEAQQDWDYHDAEDGGEDDQDGRDGESQDGADEGEGSESESEGGEGDGDADEDGQLDNNDREFNEEYLDEDYEEESDWEKMVDSLDLGRLANSALQDYANEQTELNEIRSGVGLDDAEWKMMDPKQRMEVAKRLNTPRMKAIADMVGRMKRFAMSKQAQKVIDAPHEIFDVEQGDDLRRTLRSEFAFLGTPETKIWFYYKFLTKQLLQYKERGHEDVGKGPIICCIDNSGSMGGQPENWAKGVAEALRRICQDQDRDFHAIYFETNRHRERFDFPKGRGPWEKIMAFLGISAGGGTEFDGVLTEALNKAQNFFEGKPEHGKSDIVFITDGQAYLDQGWIDKFNEERKEAGVRVFSIFISAYDSERSSAMALLQKFSDVAIPVKALEVNDDTTSELFARI